MIYPDLYPGGFFAIQMFVIGSDDNHERVRAKLEKILGNEAVKSTVYKPKGAITITSLLGAVSSIVAKLFKDGGDDLLMSNAPSGFDFVNYRLAGDAKLHDFRFRSKHAEESCESGLIVRHNRRSQYLLIQGSRT